MGKKCCPRSVELCRKKKLLPIHQWGGKDVAFPRTTLKSELYTQKKRRSRQLWWEAGGRDFKATACKHLPCFAQLLADGLQFNVERRGHCVLGTVPLSSHSRLPHQASGIQKKREHKRSMQEASVDPKAQSPAVDPRIAEMDLPAAIQTTASLLLLTRKELFLRISLIKFSAQ